MVSGQPNIALHVYPAGVRLHLLYVGLGAGYVAFLAARRRLPGPTRLDWPLALVLAVYAAAVAFSIYPRLSLETALLSGGVVLAFLVFADRELISTEAVVRVLVAAGVAASLYGLYRVGADYVHWLRLVDSVEGVGLSGLLPPSVPRVHDVGDHVNVLAMALNLCLPFALLLALRPQGPADRFLGVGGALAIALCLFFTLSRGAWLAAAPALLLFAALYSLREPGPSASARLRAVARPALGVLALAAVALLLGGALLAWRWDSRPEWLFRASLSPRYDAIEVGVKIVREKPLLGSGPNTYGLLYNVYSGDYPIENIQPHNGYLHALVDVGVVGGAVLLWASVALFASVTQAYEIGGGARRLWAAACAAALTTLALHSLVDSPNISKTALLPLAVVAAIAVRSVPAPLAPVVFLSPRNLPRLALLALVPVLAVAWFRIDRWQDKYDDSLRLLRAGDFDRAASRALAAADADPEQEAYQLHAGVTQAVAYLVAIERGQDARPGLVEGSVASLRRAIDVEPRAAAAYANLALALRLKGDKDGASAAARAAMLRAPKDGTIAAVAGTIFEWAELYGEARGAYATALTHDAGLVQSPFWLTTPFRGAVRGDAISDSFLTDCQKGRVSAIYAGLLDNLAAWADGCRRQVEAAPRDSRARSDLAVILYVLGRHDEALAEARKAVDRAPDNQYARTAAGIALSSGGDVEKVRHELLLGAWLGDPDAALLLAYTYAPPRPANGVPKNLGLVSRREPLPGEVTRLLEDTISVPTAAPMVYDAGNQRYYLGVLYIRTRLLRESPTSLLIPGEWITLASPRALLIEDAILAAHKED